MDFKSVVIQLNSKKEEEVVEGLRSIIADCNKMRKEKKDVLAEDSLIHQYLNASPHCIELFTIWNDAHGNYDKPILQALFEVLAECIRYGSDSLKKELCMTILRKQNADVLGAITSTNQYSINSVCILFRAICDVGAAGVQLLNQKIPLSSITQLPSIISNTRTRYRSSRWIASVLRNDPDVVGKQILLRQDIISALANGMQNDGEYLLNDLISLFSNTILSSHYCSTKLKQSFFSSDTLISFIQLCQKETTLSSFKQFVLHLFGQSSIVLYPQVSSLTLSSYLPSTLFKILFSLNPFKNSFDKQVYLLIIQEHPEVIPSLFQDTSKSIQTDSTISTAFEQSKSKVLIHWMLEPRDSTLWANTVDFLIDILKLPLCLPQELIVAGKEKPEYFLTTIHSWQYPCMLTRSTFSKGLLAANTMITVKTLELIETIARRVYSIAETVFSTQANALLFLKQALSILPLEDSFSQLFKKSCIELVSNKPISTIHKDTEEENAPIINMIPMEMEVEEDKEEDPKKPLYQLLYQVTVTLNSLVDLFPSQFTSFYLDISPLFTEVSNKPFLFTLQDSSITAILQLLTHMVRLNSSTSSLFFTGKNEMKPFFFLLHAYSYQTSSLIQQALEELLFVLCEESQLWTLLVEPRSTLQFYLHLLTPSLLHYLFTVVMDLRSQRIRFLSRNHHDNTQIPLLFYALMYSALKPKVQDMTVNLYLCLQGLFLTQAHCITDCLGLMKKYVNEALLWNEGEKVEGDHLLNCPMNDDILQMLRRIIEEWSCDNEPIKLRSCIKIDLTEYDKVSEETIDQALLSLYHTFLWHSVYQEDILELMKLPSLQRYLLISPCILEDLSNQQSHQVLNESLNSLLPFYQSFTAIHFSLPYNFPPRSPAHVNLILLFIYQSLLTQQFSQIDLFKQLIQCCNLEDIETLLSITSSVFLSFYMIEESLPFVLILLQYMLSFTEPISSSIQRSFIQLIQQQSSSNSIYLLTYFASALYSEEKLQLIHSILSQPSLHYEDLQIFSLPLDLSLIQQLIPAATQHSYFVSLLLHNLNHSHAPFIQQVITDSLLLQFIQLLKEPLYQQFIQFLLKTYSSLHCLFWSLILSPACDSILYQFFPFITNLLILSLTHPDILHTPSEQTILTSIQSSSFFTDLVNNLSSTQLSVYLECFQLLTKYPQFSSSVPIDIITICKQSFKKEALTYQRFSTILCLCQQESNEKATGLLILRCIQELAKNWGKNGTSEEEDLNQVKDELTSLLLQSPSILQLLLKKQQDLITKFCRFLLRNQLEDWRALRLLRVWIQSSYQLNIILSGITDVNIIELITTHSSYSMILKQLKQECVCSNDNELRQRWLSFTPEHYKYSVEFFNLILVVLKNNPFACSQALFFQLLSLYNCSLSPSDLILRSIFQLLHSSKRFLLEDVGYLFGEFAPTSASDNIQTPSNWLLEAVSGLRIRKSIESFPREKETEMEEEHDDEEEDNEEEEEKDLLHDEEDEDIYRMEQLEMDEEKEVVIPSTTPSQSSFNPNLDCIELLLTQEFHFECKPNDSILLIDPSIYLPLLHYYFSITTIDVHSYLSHGVPGYLLACLSSSNLIIRQCASCLLQRFYELLQDSSFYEQKQICLAFRKLQNSIETPTIQLSSIPVSFFNESLGILLRPGNTLYSYVNRFYLSFPTFNLNDVPLFNQLFLNEQENYKQLRAWCLRYILRGTQSYQDYVILNRRHVVSQVQALLTAANTDLYTQKCCLGIILRLSSIPAVAPILYHNTGIFPWLSMILPFMKSRVLLYTVLQILLNILQSDHMALTEGVIVDSLIVLKQLFESVKVSAAGEELGDMNKLVLGGIQGYLWICQNWERSENGIIEELFYCIWKMILNQVKTYKGKKTEEGISLILSNCVLSNDDFFLLCDPQLKSMEVCYSECCELLKEIKKVLPFSSSLFYESEELYDSLFL